MAKNKMKQEPIAETFDSIEEMAEFWDTHDVTDYEEILTPVEATIVAHPKHEYVITLSDTLHTKLKALQESEGVSLNTLVNLWVQEKLQEYAIPA